MSTSFLIHGAAHGAWCSDRAVETLRDLVITPGQQRAMYERRGVKHVYTLDTGHTAMYADPRGVANILDDVSSKQG
jgi:hypothetical protein